MMAGTIRKRGEHTWELRTELGRDPETGKRQFRYQYVQGTKKLAEQTLTETLHRRDTGSDVTPNKITVAEYLDRWIRDYAEDNVAPSTLQRYRQIVERLKPLLGALRLQDIRPAHIQEAYGRLRRDELAARTVLHHHRVLHEALKQAVRWQFLANNPADATAPRAHRDARTRSLGRAPGSRCLCGSTAEDHHLDGGQHGDAAR